MVWQALARPICVYAAALVVCAWLALQVRSQRRRAVWAALTMLLGWGVEGIVKAVVGRERPVLHRPVEHLSGYSFPSGHVANAALAVLVVLILLWPLMGAVLRVVGSAIGLVFVLVTALDRVLLGVHFPSDTLAGVLYAVCVGLGSALTFRMFGCGSSGFGSSGLARLAPARLAPAHRRA